MQHLRAELGVRVVSTRPDDGTTSFVRVIATGGPGRSRRILQGVQLTIDCYDTSAGRAFTLANRVDEVMHGLPASDVSVAAVPWSTTPADYPDPDTGSPRYTGTYQLTVKTI